MVISGRVRLILSRLGTLSESRQEVLDLDRLVVYSVVMTRRVRVFRRDGSVAAEYEPSSSEDAAAFVRALEHPPGQAVVPPSQALRPAEAYVNKVMGAYSALRGMSSQSLIPALGQTGHETTTVELCAASGIGKHGIGSACAAATKALQAAGLSVAIERIASTGGGPAVVKTSPELVEAIQWMEGEEMFIPF